MERSCRDNNTCQRHLQKNVRQSHLNLRYEVCPPVSSWKACAKISLDDLATCLSKPTCSNTCRVTACLSWPTCSRTWLVTIYMSFSADSSRLFGLGLPLLLHTLDALLNVHHQAWARLLGCQEKTKAQGYKDRVDDKLFSFQQNCLLTCG